MKFEGTGFILTGSYLPTGGMAEVFLDEEPGKTIDVYMEGGERGQESLFHRFNLTDGPHTVRIAVQGKPYSGSIEEKKETNVVVRDLVVFR